jgi:hypothetical protein
MHTRLWGICARESAFCFPTIPSGAAERKKFHRFKRFRIFFFIIFFPRVFSGNGGGLYLSVSDVQTFDPMSDLQLRLFIFLCFFNYTRRLDGASFWLRCAHGPPSRSINSLSISLLLSSYLLWQTNKQTRKNKKKKREEVTQQVYTFIHYKWPRVFRLNEIEERLIKYGPSGWVISITPYGHLCLANE